MCDYRVGSPLTTIGGVIQAVREYPDYNIKTLVRIYCGSQTPNTRNHQRAIYRAFERAEKKGFIRRTPGLSLRTGRKCSRWSFVNDAR